MNELKDVVVFSLGENKTPFVLDYGKYTVGDIARKLLKPNDDCAIENGIFFDKDTDEIYITREESQKQYGEVPISFTSTFACNFWNVELIPVSRLTDVGNEKYLQVAKEVAKKFPIYKAVTEMVHLLYND